MIEWLAASVPSLGISEFLEDLIDRELQFLACPCERQIPLQAEVDIESMKNAGCRWLPGYDLANRLSCGEHKARFTCNRNGQAGGGTVTYVTRGQKDLQRRLQESFQTAQILDDDLSRVHIQ